MLAAHLFLACTRRRDLNPFVFLVPAEPRVRPLVWCKMPTLFLADICWHSHHSLRSTWLLWKSAHREERERLIPFFVREPQLNANLG